MTATPKNPGKPEPAPQGWKSLMGEAPKLAVLLFPLLALALAASFRFPRALAFLGKWRGVGLALGIELGAAGLLFWASAAWGLIRAWKAGKLATRGAYGLCRHPIFTWWIFSVLPGLAFGLDSWALLLLAPVFYFLVRPAARREEVALRERFPGAYDRYAARTRPFLPLPYLAPLSLRRCGRALLGLLGWGLFAFLVLLALVAPAATTLGTSAAERGASYPGDGLLSPAASGFTQAVSIEAPPEAVWPWLVQVGYRRAGWYNVDAINRLAGKDYFLEGRGSARRIIPELQNLAVGDTISLAPGMDFQVLELEPARLLVIAGGLSEDRTKAAVVWTFRLEARDEGTRLLSRFRSEPIEASAPARFLWNFVGLLGGPIIQQPAMFHGLRSRAEAAYRER